MDGTAAMRAWHGAPYRLAAALSVVAMLAGGCSSDNSDDIEYQERPVDELYNSAMDALEAGEYKLAATEFDEVERQHPYSTWATKSQLMAAYANYQADQYDDAIASLDRFIQLHPANPDVPYAMYMKGLCYYERISDPARDQRMTRLAYQSFEELMSRYPESEYARDARLKLDLADDHLAAKEMVVGRFYLRRGYHLAAINRFQRVIDNYQTTTHVPEALLRLTEAYTAIGLDEEAQRTAAVLGYNFPGSSWYVDAYALLDSPPPLVHDEPTADAQTIPPAPGAEAAPPNVDLRPPGANTLPPYVTQ